MDLVVARELGLAVVLWAGCFSPPTRECTVACGVGDLCPDDYSCLADGYCHASADEELCVAGESPDAASAPDAMSAVDASPHGSASLPASADTHVWQELATRNFGNALVFGSDGGSASGNHLVALVRFDLSSIPPGSRLEATPRFVIHTTSNRLDQGSAEVYQVLEAWTEGNGNDTDGVANWNERGPGQGWSTAGVGAGSRMATPLATFTPDAGEAEYVIELPNTLVEGWIDDPAANHGLAVQVPPGGGYGVTFHSRTSTTADRRPRLEVDYCTGCP